MIEINLCVPLGLSRGNQSWFNCVMTSISVGENSSGSSHLIAQQRGLLLDVILVELEKGTFL